MLESMRQNTKSLQIFFWLVVAAFIVAPLAGVFRSRGGSPGSQNAAALVNGEPISFTNLEQQYRNLYNFYRQIYGDNLTPDVLQNLGLEQAALDQLIEQALLVQGARSSQLQVSEDELVKTIHDIPQFQKNGRFDADTYTTLLTRSRMTPQDFEARMEEDLLAQKMELVIKESVRVSDQEVRLDYVTENEKVQVEGIVLKHQQFVEAVEVTEDERASYYADNSAEFTTPPRIKVQYVALTFENFAHDITIAEEALKEYYATHETEFNKGKEVQASHILLRVEAEADEAADAEALQKAVEIRQRLDEGAEFADLAKTHSEDPGSAVNGGDLGFFSKGMMVPEFEAAAFALEPGSVSEPVRTQFGYHLIKVAEVREDADPYATALPVIEERLKSEEAKTLSQQKADAVYQQVLDDKSLQQAAEESELVAVTSEFFAQGEPIDETLGMNWQVQNVAFTLSPLERFSQPIEAADGFYVLEFLEEQDPYVPELAEIESEVKDAVIQKKAGELALTEAQALKDALDAGTTIWADMLADEQNETISPEPFSRRQQYVSELGSKTKDVAALAFGLQEGAVSEVVELSDAYCILSLKEKVAIDEDLFAEQKAELTKQLLSKKQNLVFDEFVEDLKQQAEIRISELLQDQDGA